MVDKIRELLMSSDEVNYKLAIELCRGQNVDIEELKNDICDQCIAWTDSSYWSKPYWLAIASGIYAHGKLEDDLGTDILYLPVTDWNRTTQSYNLFIKPGIQTIKIFHNNKEIEATLFYWIDKLNFKHGLVIYPDDPSKDKVLKLYNKRVMTI